ncbi:MAG: TonB-dependent receptor [Acidobacteria bacterium]|nr:TonB-dependent receptor [Thermoanaerobaculia bacterium]NLN11823.1 TonB-dependent receptor [Acidobacteriota bacterium]MBP7814257.1 TonB-dependent receptor [Thermoanaerobaculia bacterium]HPA95563.1 TonB-dependent receptor [Thermoanaerobaculia bacterium]HRR13987.1 TonB-dependent receptor [Thermoanaerobaculia bacterium]
MKANVARSFGNRLTLLVTASVLFFVATPGWPQGDLTGSVVVTVTDADGGALPGVTLALRSAARTFAGTTNASGQYRFLVVPAGTYDLQAELSGFTPALLTGLNIRFGETYSAALTLQIGAFEETVTVSAAPPQVDVTQSASSETLEQQFVQDIPLRNRNFEDLVSLMPGVADGQVRGSRDTSTGFRIDGVTNVDPYTGGVEITFSQHAIDRFEMVPNGFQARYGDFSGGVVNVTTRSGANQFAGHLGYYFRNDNFVAAPPVRYPDQEHRKAPDTRRFTEVALGGAIVPDKVHYFTTLEYRTSDIGTVFAVRTSETDSYLGSLKLNYTPRAEDQWVFFGASNINRTDNTVATRFVAPEHNANRKDDRSLLTVQQSHIFSDSLFLESQLSYLRVTDGLGRADPNAHVTLYTFTPTGTYTSGMFTSNTSHARTRIRLTEALTWYRDDHQIRLGVDVGHLATRLDQNITPTRFDFRPLGNDLALHYYFDPVRYDESGGEGAAYAQDTWRVTKGVTLDFGIRAEYQSVTGNTDLAPRLGMSWDVRGDARTKLYANAGRYIERVYDRYLEWGSQPGGDFYYVFDPTGELADGTEVPGGTFGYRILGDNKTPYADAWTVGVEHLVGRDLRIGLAFTDKRLRRQLLTYYTSDNAEDWYEFEADGEGRYRGVDLVATKRFSDRWEGRASYTWSRQTGMGAYLDTFYGATQIPPVNSIEDTDRTNVVKLSGFGQLPWEIVLSGSYTYATGLPYSVVTYDANGNPLFVGKRNSHRMGNTQSLDLSIQKRIRIKGTALTLVAEGFNLTNHENVTAVTTAVDEHGEPTAFDVGRTFQFGVKIDF